MAPVYDFSPAFRNLNDSISGLGKSFEEADLRKRRAGIGQDVQSGNFSGAAAKAFESGDIDSGLKFMGLGREAADNASADKNMPLLVGGAQFGQQQPAGLNGLGMSAANNPETPIWAKGGGLADYSLYGGPGGATVRKPSSAGPIGDLGAGYNPQGQAPAFTQSQPLGPSRDFNGIFSTAEQQYGLPSGYLARTAQIESNGNPRAANPNSSARGLFQFIGSTAKQYGLSDPFDPAASTEAAARLAMDNANVLRRGLNREPTGAELYLAHQQGAGGAMKLLSNPNVRAADVVGADAVRLNGGNANMTAGEFAGLWLNKFGNGQGGQGGGQQTQVAQAKGPTPDQARAGIARIDTLLRDAELIPKHRQDLEQRRQRYAQVLEGGEQQGQADMPEQGAMEAQQAFQIPGTGQVVPAGTRITQRAQTAIRIMSGNASAGRKKLAEIALQEELKAANPMTQLEIEGKRLSNEEARQRLGRGETTANITEYNYAKRQGYTGSFDKFLTDKAQKTTVDMRGESEEAKAMGQAAGKRAGETMNAAFLGGKQLQRIGQIEALMQNVETGKLAPARMNLGAWAKELGMSEEAMKGMGLDPARVGDAQALNAIAGRMVIDMIGAGGFPANNFSDADRQFIVGTVPQLANDPRGNRLIMEAARRTAQLDIQKAKEWRQWKHANKSGSFDDFEMLWADQMGSKNHFADLAEQASAITGARPGTQQGQQQQPASGAVRIQSQQQYQSLPRGATYVDPQGNVRTKQ